MKLNSAQLEQTLSQFEAQAIPEDHPMVPKLCELFGDHTFFSQQHRLERNRAKFQREYRRRITGRYGSEPCRLERCKQDQPCASQSRAD
jgi:hypothetical protein